MLKMAIVTAVAFGAGKALADVLHARMYNTGPEPAAAGAAAAMGAVAGTPAGAAVQAAVAGTVSAVGYDSGSNGANTQ